MKTFHIPCKPTREFMETGLDKADLERATRERERMEAAERAKRVEEYRAFHNVPKYVRTVLSPEERAAHKLAYNKRYREINREKILAKARERDRLRRAGRHTRPGPRSRFAKGRV